MNRSSCDIVYVIAGGGGGGADMPIAVQQPKCRVERRERKVGGRLAIQCVLYCFTIVRARRVAVLSKFIAIYYEEIKSKVCFEGFASYLVCELVFTLKHQNTQSILLKGIRLRGA